MLTCVHAFMLACVYVSEHSECNHSMNMFSQLVGLSIEGHSIRLHMNAAGFTAAHPANRGAVEGRPAADVLLVYHSWFRLLFGRLRFWQLEFQELVCLLKAAEGHGTSSKGR